MQLTIKDQLLAKQAAAYANDPTPVGFYNAKEYATDISTDTTTAAFTIMHCCADVRLSTNPPATLVEIYTHGSAYVEELTVRCKSVRLDFDYTHSKIGGAPAADGRLAQLDGRASDLIKDSVSARLAAEGHTYTY
jgi:hypothetical protein